MKRVKALIRGGTLGHVFRIQVNFSIIKPRVSLEVKVGSALSRHCVISAPCTLLGFVSTLEAGLGLLLGLQERR